VRNLIDDPPLLLAGVTAGERCPGDSGTRVGPTAGAVAANSSRMTYLSAVYAADQARVNESANETPKRPGVPCSLKQLPQMPMTGAEQRTTKLGITDRSVGSETQYPSTQE